MLSGGPGPLGPLGYGPGPTDPAGGMQSTQPPRPNSAFHVPNKFIKVSVIIK